MARLNGLKALFTGRDVANVFDEFRQQAEDKMLLAMQYAGEQFVNKARLTGNYTDDTGNLRSSIGYVILYNGEVVKANFQKHRGSADGDLGVLTGYDKANEIAAEVASDFPDGFVLIGVAGMEYAAAVEAKGYDVITGSAPTSESLKSLFDGIDFGY